MSKNTANEDKKRRPIFDDDSRCLFIVLSAIWAVIGVLLVVAIITWACQGGPKKQEKKTEDLTIKSMDGAVTLSFSDAVCEGRWSTQRGVWLGGGNEVFRQSQYKSDEEFYNNVVFANPAYCGTVCEEYDTDANGTVFYSADKKVIPTSYSGYALFFVNNHYFMLRTNNATKQLLRAGYYVELTEACLKIADKDSMIGYLPFPEAYGPNMGNEREYMVDSEEPYRFTSKRSFACNFEMMSVFYSRMNDALYRIDEASKTIYVKVGVKCVAMMTFGEEEMELSFVESFPEAEKQGE